MLRPTRRNLLVAAFLVALAFLPLWLLVGDSRTGLIGTWAALPLALVVSALAVPQPETGGSRLLEETFEYLVAQTRTRFLRDELVGRGLTQDLIAVEWEVSEAGRGSPGISSVRTDERGLEDLARKFLDASSRHLLILGGSGSGKSSLVLLLMDSLLRRTPLRQVPVLIPAMPMNYPSDLDRWICHVTARAFPKLGDDGYLTAQELWERNLIVPIIDGLDEISEEQQVRLVEYLELKLDAQEPIILTSRELLPTLQARNLRWVSLRAEPLPIRAPVVHSILSSEFMDARMPPPVLGAAFTSATSSALFLSLARTLVRSGDSLETLREVPDPGLVRKGLIEGLLPALLRGAMRRRGGVASLSRRQRRVIDVMLQEANARPWLTFIARHLEERRLRDIYLWELPSALGQVDRVVVGAIAGVTGAVAFALFPALLFGMFIGCLIGGALSFAVATRRRGRLRQSLDERAPRQSLRLRLLPKGPLHTFVFGGILGVGVSIALQIAALRGSSLGLVAAIVGGMVVGASIGLVKPAVMDQKYVTGDVEDFASARELLESDRKRTVWLLVGVPTIALPILLVYGPLFAGLALGAVGSILALLVVEFSLNGAWLSFALARLLFCVNGRLPLRLVTFLEACHSIHVLRRSSGGYQFRHEELRHHLAGVPQRP